MCLLLHKQIQIPEREYNNELHFSYICFFTILIKFVFFAIFDKIIILDLFFIKLFEILLCGVNFCYTWSRLFFYRD
jgi:hypothetical protein